MKKITFIFCLIFSFSSFSQTKSSTILSKNNIKLLNEIEVAEKERKIRVDQFIHSNETIKRTIKEGMKIMQLWDIIDDLPIYKSTFNLNAARATKVTHLQVGGSLGLDLDGTGITIGVWDGGPSQNTHVEFMNSTDTASRVEIIDNVVVDGDTGFSDHGTHVTGIISAKGVDPSAMGMATNVSIKSYNWSGDTAEMTTAANAATNPIILSNHSYGVPVNQGLGNLLPAWIMGAYTTSSRTIDGVMYNNPQYLAVWAAGNDGTTSYTGGLVDGFDKLTHENTAKNILSVANANPSIATFTFELTGVSINGGSSEGPTDDLRIKPDISADGSFLYSPIPTNSYAVFSGTSMAAPNTTGALVLLQEYYKQLNGNFMLGATAKALVCHTASDQGQVGPDPIFGWGFLDALEAANMITANDNGTGLIEENTLGQGESYSRQFTVAGGDKLSASIVWTDFPGPAVNNILNSSNPALMNDLDLRITRDSDGAEFFPWKLKLNGSVFSAVRDEDNNVDNVERIDIDLPTAGTYTLTVTHKGTLSGNVGGPFDPQSQNFSLILSGNNLTLSSNDNAISDFRLWPNPTSEVLNINFKSIDNRVDIYIYDINGRKVYNKILEGSNSLDNYEIDVSSFSSGFYFLKIKNGNRIFNEKIIVEK